jgi:uncharacterized Zn finger protein (UPF0148 family)
MHPRQIATEKGEKFYQGKPCKKCGNTLRYTSMTGCVNCTKKNSIKRFENGDVKEWVQKNREKVNASNRKRYNLLSPDEKRKRNRKQQISLYGLTVEQYDAILMEQKCVCAICGKPEKSSSKGVLSIDHDHVTGKVRGLLCDTCNSGLGHFYDSIDLLQGAMLYLKTYST